MRCAESRFLYKLFLKKRIGLSLSPNNSGETGRSGIEEQVLVALRRIIRAIDLHSRLLVQQHGITGPQLIVLREIATTGLISAGDLAKRVSLSKGTVSGILERLEKRALVVRERSSSDRRQVHIQATEQGFAMLGSAPSPLQDQFVRKFSALQDWEQSLLLSSVQRIVSMMEAEDIDASAVLTTGPISAGAAQAEQTLNETREGS